MAAKRVDPLKAKQAKQKKIAIAGVLLLVAMLAIQGPKTMKMLKGPQPVTPPAAAVPAPATPGTTTPAPAAGAPATGAPAAGETPQPATVDVASLADSDSAPEAGAGQLLSFERFASKDPFAQQAQPVVAPAPAPGAGEQPADGVAKPAGEGTPAEGGGTAAPADGGFTTGGTPPAPVERAAATSIAVNGVAEDVKVEAEFPLEEPTFVLVSVAADGKSVEIGIAGGAYADGDPTLKLALGKKITLQNTADGSRYELELLAVEGFPVPKKG